MLVRTLRGRTVATIAVVSRCIELHLAVYIRTQRRPLPLFRNRSVLSAIFSGNIQKFLLSQPIICQSKALWIKIENEPVSNNPETSSFFSFYGFEVQEAISFVKNIYFETAPVHHYAGICSLQKRIAASSSSASISKSSKRSVVLSSRSLLTTLV